jgi:hypothetical protein
VEVKCQPWRDKDDQPCPSEREGFGKEKIKEKKEKRRRKKERLADHGLQILSMAAESFVWWVLFCSAMRMYGVVFVSRQEPC